MTKHYALEGGGGGGQGKRAGKGSMKLGRYRVPYGVLSPEVPPRSPGLRSAGLLHTQGSQVRLPATPLARRANQPER